MGSTELPSLVTSFTVQKALKSKAFIFLINQLAINLTWSELTTEPHINCYEVCLKFHLVWLFIHFVVETFCCQMLPLTSHEYYAMHMVYSFYYPTEMWKAVKRDSEALDKGYDSLNYFYCTYVRIFESRSICLQVKS